MAKVSEVKRSVKDQGTCGNNLYDSVALRTASMATTHQNMLVTNRSKDYYSVFIDF